MRSKVPIFKKHGLIRPGLTLGVQTGQTNLLRYSEALDNAAWVKSGLSVAANNATDPNEGQTADTITVDTSGANYITQEVKVIPSTVYVFSFYAKSDTLSVPKYSIYDNSNGADIAASTSYATSINGSTFSRVLAAFTTPAGCTSIYVYLSRNSTGTGTLIVWGGMVNEGPTALSYVATTDLQSIVSIPPGSGSLVRGANTGASTDDPTVSLLGWTLDSGDRVAGLPAKGTAWTTFNCSDTEIHCVTSIGTKYINGVSNTSGAEWALETVGAYVGILTGFYRYNRVFTHGEVYRVTQYLKSRINAAGGLIP